jgi:AcrR family transcriptional regulator
MTARTLDVDPALDGAADGPAGIDPVVFQAALATFVAGRRLDMQALAADLGMSRSTLYRRVKDRDELLGEVVWHQTRRVMLSVVAQVDAEGLSGAERVLEITRRFMAVIAAQQPLRQLLDREPEAALRILTSKHGPVQRNLVALSAGILQEEVDAGRLRLSIDPATLAYVIVRIGESFLYADAIADRDPDLELATEVIARLLREPADPDAPAP